jgi:hypothetical protein
MKPITASVLILRCGSRFEWTAAILVFLLSSALSARAQSTYSGPFQGKFERMEIRVDGIGGCLFGPVRATNTSNAGTLDVDSLRPALCTSTDGQTRLTYLVPSITPVLGANRNFPTNSPFLARLTLNTTAKPPTERERQSYLKVSATPLAQPFGVVAATNGPPLTPGQEYTVSINPTFQITGTQVVYDRTNNVWTGSIRFSCLASGNYTNIFLSPWYGLFIDMTAVYRFEPTAGQLYVPPFTVTFPQTECPVSSTFTLTNTGGVPVSWQAVARVPGVTNLLSVSPASGSLGPTSSQQLTLNVNAGSLSRGLHTGQLVFTSPQAYNSPYTSSVSLNVQLGSQRIFTATNTSPPPNSELIQGSTQGFATEIDYNTGDLCEADVVLRALTNNTVIAESGPLRVRQSDGRASVRLVLPPFQLPKGATVLVLEPSWFRPNAPQQKNSIAQFSYRLVPGNTTNELEVLQRSPPAGTTLTNNSEVAFSAQLRYQLGSHPSGQISLNALNSRGEFVAGTGPIAISRSDQPQTQTLLIAPISIRPEMDSIILSAQLTAGGEVLIERRLSSYPIIGTDHLAIRNPSPPSGTSLPPGSSVAFSVEAEYRLDSAESGELILDLLDAKGTEIASTGPRLINRSSDVRQMTLSMSAITIPDKIESLGLRVRMVSKGTVLKEGLQVVPYPVRANFEAVEVVGDVDVILPGGIPQPLVTGAKLERGTRIYTGVESKAVIAIGDNRITIKELTDVRLDDLHIEGDADITRLWLAAGAVSAAVTSRHEVRADFQIRTPTATCSVRGTEFTVSYVAQPEPTTSLFVTSGVVLFTPQNLLLPGITVSANQSAQITSTRVVAPTGPAITSLNANRATAGTQLTINGSNFSSAAASNIVSFGGFWGTVVSASANQLVAIVPDSLATAVEPVSVTVNGLTSNSTNLHVIAARAATIVSGNVTGVWTRARSPYLLNADTVVPAGGSLRIEPGVVVTVEGLTTELFVSGALMADGTNGAPIRFTSTSTNKVSPQWGALVIQDSSDDAQTRLVNCTVEYGGYSRQATLEIHSASPRLEGVTARGSSTNGLYLNDSAARLTNCVFSGNANSAIAMNVASFPSLRGNFASRNGFNGIGVSAGSFVRSGTWMNDGLTYRLVSDVTVTRTNTLTIEPGIIVEFADINGDLIVEGTLRAIGVPGKPITFTSAGTNTTRGQWASINIGPTSTNTALEYCIVERGGYFRSGAIEINGASPTIRHCAIGSSSTYGLALSGAIAPRIENCSFVNNTLSAVSITPGAFPLLGNNAASGNGANSIAVQGGTLSQNGTWLRDEIPYTLQTDLVVATNSVLTIAPGTTVQFADINGDLWVDGALVAQGTATQPIRFTTDKPRPVPGSWAAIILRNRTAPSLFQHCAFEWGGYSRNANMELLGASPLISDCVFRISAGDGLFAQNSSSVVLRSQFVNNARDGIRVDGTAGFRVHLSVLSSNTAWGLRNLTAQVVPAQTNYWGHPSGPLDNANSDGLGLLNPLGLGDEVGEYVNWSGFLTAEPTSSISAQQMDLRISRDVSGNVTLSWSAGAAVAVLEESASIGAGARWTAVNVTTTNLSGRIQATLRVAEAQRFFRLTSR